MTDIKKDQTTATPTPTNPAQSHNQNNHNMQPKVAPVPAAGTTPPASEKKD